ncbi:MAG: histidinol-phosphatase HisJ family protein [Promethearchaeota archaeon]
MKENLFFDWHVHSNCSCDCTMYPSEACAAALKSNLNGLCFTDHIDFDPRDEGIGYFNWKNYIMGIEEAKQNFQNLMIKTGFEINWQKIYKKQILEFLRKKKVDFILGSVHWVSTGFINNKTTYINRVFDDFIDEWVKEALSLLDQNICHGFAHIDYFYLQTQTLYPHILREEIFEWVEEVIEKIIKYEVSLEINTSAMRKGLKEPFPSWDFLKKYKKAGGFKFHLGSDAHRSNHIGLFFNKILKKINKIF